MVVLPTPPFWLAIAMMLPKEQVPRPPGHHTLAQRHRAAKKKGAGNACLRFTWNMDRPPDENNSPFVPRDYLFLLPHQLFSPFPLCGLAFTRYRGYSVDTYGDIVLDPF